MVVIGKEGFTGLVVVIVGCLWEVDDGWVVDIQ
jgi:hypothetical protein